MECNSSVCRIEYITFVFLIFSFFSNFLYGLPALSLPKQNSFTFFYFSINGLPKWTIRSSVLIDPHYMFPGVFCHYFQCVLWPQDVAAGVRHADKQTNMHTHKYMQALFETNKVTHTHTRDKHTRTRKGQTHTHTRGTHTNTNTLIQTHTPITVILGKNFSSLLKKKRLKNSKTRRTQIKKKVRQRQKISRNKLKKNGKVICILIIKEVKTYKCKQNNNN